MKLKSEKRCAYERAERYVVALTNPLWQSMTDIVGEVAQLDIRKGATIVAVQSRTLKDILEDPAVLGREGVRRLQ